MPKQNLARFGLVVLLGLALALSGCGNSKKGGGSSYIVPLHSALAAGPAAPRA
jgi:hypothetical protein